jgi:hypothetical protein
MPDPIGDAEGDRCGTEEPGAVLETGRCGLGVDMGVVVGVTTVLLVLGALKADDRSSR